MIIDAQHPTTGRSTVGGLLVLSSHTEPRPTGEAQAEPWSRGDEIELHLGWTERRSFKGVHGDSLEKFKTDRKLSNGDGLN